MSIVVLQPKPTVSDAVKKSVIDILEEALTLARAGEIASCVVILNREDGLWHESFSGTVNWSRDVGQLEIVKQRLIREFLEQPPK